MTPTEAAALINCDQLRISKLQTWFDLGCGSGLFSNALIGLLPEGSFIYAIDKQLATFNNRQIKFQKLDFIKDQLPNLSVDGILMANSLHYVKDKLPFLIKIKKLLSTKGVFLLVDYDTETSNQWIPHPISFRAAKNLFKELGFDDVYKINERLSIFNEGSIYSAVFYNS